MVMTMLLLVGMRQLRGGSDGLEGGGAKRDGAARLAPSCPPVSWWGPSPGSEGLPHDTPLSAGTVSACLRNPGGLVPWRSLGHLLTRCLPAALSITDKITCLECRTHSLFHDDPSQIPNLMIHPGVLYDSRGRVSTTVASKKV